MEPAQTGSIRKKRKPLKFRISCLNYPTKHAHTHTHTHTLKSDGFAGKFQET